MKSCGLRLDLTYEDELVGDVNIESDADRPLVGNRDAPIIPE